MGMQANNTSSGKTQQPPQPEIGQMKPMQMGAPAGGTETGNLKPMQTDMPAGMGTGGGAATFATGTTTQPGGTGPGKIVYSNGGTTIDSNGVRRFSDGSSEQLTQGTIDYLLNPGAAAGLIQATGNGQQVYPQGGAGAGATPTGGNAGGAVFGGGSATGGGSGGGGFGAGAVPSAIDDTSRRRVEQAILSRLEPQFRQDEERMRNQLLSSGLEVGSPAYTAELQRLQQGQNDARQQAILTGGTEESRQVGMNAQLQGQAFNQGLQGAQFDNATRQQMLSELLLQRNTPLNELNSLRTGSQVSMPNFGGYYTNNSAAAPIFDAAQAQGNYDLARAQQEQSGFNSMLGGLATLGGAGIMKFSDLRLKEDVKPIGRTVGGHNLYSWKWKDGSGYDTGVIAQEVQKLRPDAVVEGTSGYLMVDYAKIH